MTSYPKCSYSIVFLTAVAASINILEHPSFLGDFATGNLPFTVNTNKFALTFKCVKDLDISVNQPITKII